MHEGCHGGRAAVPPEGDMAGRKGQARKAARWLRVREEVGYWGGERDATKGDVCRPLEFITGLFAGPGQGW